MSNPDECSDHKIIDKPNSCYGFDLDGKFCDVLCLLKQKYPHIKGMKDIASATLMRTSKSFASTSHWCLKFCGLKIIPCEEKVF